MARPDGQRGIEARQRLGEALLVEQCIAAIEQGAGMTRIERQHLLESAAIASPWRESFP